jgi:hypothetical protein
MPKNRYFFSQKQIGEYKWMESLIYSRAKRENRNVGSYYGIACGCGCGPFPYETTMNITEQFGLNPQNKL